MKKKLPKPEEEKCLCECHQGFIKTYYPQSKPLTVKMYEETYEKIQTHKEKY